MNAQIKHFSASKNSMIQSALSEYLNTHADGSGLNATHPRLLLLNKVLELVAAHRAAGAPQGFLQKVANELGHLAAELAQKLGLSSEAICFVILEQYVDALLASDTALAAQKLQELRFSNCDPGWVEAVITWFDTYIEQMKQPKYVLYNSLDDFAYSLPTSNPPATSLKVGLLGDWGTGEGRATEVLDHLFALRPDVIIHVGDVYYSGTTYEYQQNYLALIEAARRKHNLPIPVYNLPGNHDYYSGGQAYYDALAQVQPAGSGQPVQQASYFVLANDKWHLQGMDTGYYDNDVLKVNADTTHLHDTEVLWHQHHLQQATAAGKNIILLSHHQLFSRYLAIAGLSYNPQLLNPFNEYIQQGQICAWFWGHEHIAELYAPHLGLARGRCVGHGAVPIFYDGGAPYTEAISAPDLPTETIPAVPNNGQVYDQGFVLLELGDTALNSFANYYYVQEGQPETTRLYREALGEVPFAKPN